jgi:hypothetical protein
MQEENQTTGVDDFPAFSMPLDPNVDFGGAEAGGVADLECWHDFSLDILQVFFDLSFLCSSRVKAYLLCHASKHIV